MNKKGSLPDVFYISVIGLVMALLFIIALYIIGQFNTNIAPVLNAQASGSGDPITHIQNFAQGSFNTIYLIIFVGLIIAIVITAFLTDIHPIFFPLFVLFSIGAVILSAILSNVYESISSVSQFTTAVSSIPSMNYIMLKLPYFLSGILLIVLVVLFGKSRSSFGGTSQVQ